MSALHCGDHVARVAASLSACVQLSLEKSGKGTKTMDATRLRLQSRISTRLSNMGSRTDTTQQLRDFSSGILRHRDAVNIISTLSQAPPTVSCCHTYLSSEFDCLGSNRPGQCHVPLPANHPLSASIRSTVAHGAALLNEVVRKIFCMETSCPERVVFSGVGLLINGVELPPVLLAPTTRLPRLLISVQDLQFLACVASADVLTGQLTEGEGSSAVIVLPDGDAVCTLTDLLVAVRTHVSENSIGGRLISSAIETAFRNCGLPPT